MMIQMRIHNSYIFKLFNFYIAAAALLFTACDSYLDELPDNRMEVTSADKINKLLVTAYSTSAPMLVAEYSSDNVDKYQDNPNATRFIDQVYNWQDITESNNESTENFWESSYEAIATANLALESIEEFGGATTTQLKEARGEALLCRAYAHFMLVNIFAQAYNSQTSSSDMGIVYMENTADDITANPERSSVADVYAKIERDLLEGISLVGSDYTVPKYHFNLKAAYAFACRFYLYYEQWDKAIEYANLCLGSAPQAMLRDWKAMADMTQTFAALSQHYIDASLNCNLLLMTAYSAMGIVFGPYNYWSRYAHGKYLARHEDGEATNIWGSARFYQGMHTYAATNLDKTIFFKLPYLFEYVDAIAGTGYYRTVYPAFTADECLLNRAEAYVLTGRNNEAAADLTMWMQNIIQTTQELSPDDITDFYNSVDYAYSDEKGIGSTIKKHLHPTFDIGEEGDTKEAMLQCVLGFRRIETLQTGLRWYDVKRYGIEIVRREIDAAGEPAVFSDILRRNDNRRAIQIPFKVRAAGVEGNPRGE